MATDAHDDEVLDRLFEDFARRCRAGEQPSLEEYARDYPHLAEAIREIFPALQAIEQFAPLGGDSTDPPVSRLDERAVPKCLGEYQLLREVGRGGMGIVYEAVQESLGRRVAVKVLPPHPMMTPSQLQRFQLEARTGAQLHHTHIVPVYGVGKQDGVHYYAMEFIEGQGLDEVIHELNRVREDFEPQTTAPRSEVTKTIALGMMSGGFAQPQPAAAEQTSPAALAGRASGSDGSPVVARSPDRAMRRGRETRAEQGETRAEQRSTTGRTSATLSTRPDAPYYRGVATVGLHVAEALAYAHRHGVLHRDVKPSNLMLDTSGHVWVTDFGLAKVEGTAGVTRTGDAAGTLLYMAPERFDGRSEPSSDIYGLGATLYELLTLEPPFKDSSKVRLIDRIREEEPKRPRQLDRRIPRDLETIVLKAMDKEPAHRYATADELAKDLECYLSDRPVKARRISAIERTWRWCRRNPAVAALSGAVVILLLTLVAVLGYRLQDLEKRIFHFSVASSHEALTDPDLVLKFGLYESLDRMDLHGQFKPVLKEISRAFAKQTGQSVRIDATIFQKYEDAIQKLADGEVDFVRFGPVSYVEARRREQGIRLLAMELEGESTDHTHPSYIFVRKGSGITDVKQLLGKRIAFGDEWSTSTKYFKWQLKKAGITKGLVEIKNFDRHDQVTAAVADGRADVGFVRYSHFDNASRTYPDELEVLGEPFRVPNKPWAARAGLDKAVFTALQDGLLNFKEKAKLKLWIDVDGFDRATPEEYDPVEEVVSKSKAFDDE